MSASPSKPKDKSIISATSLYKSFGPTPALRGASVEIQRGHIVAIMGPSGSGKSTLLHCLAGIITPDKGAVRLNGQLISSMNEEERTALRRNQLGFVFQFGQLIPELSAIDNVAISLLLQKRPRQEAYELAEHWLNKVGISDQAEKLPGQLSGGQAQRVAIARALVTEPSILFADEPTGSLDSLTGEKVMELFINSAKEQGTTVVIVTHEPRVAAYANYEIFVRDGKVSGQD